ncbi:uncharacterized protein LOC127731862 isoform X2 [Mytilus californianus]|uniref:uncharacterized protein LOC127731862 isoform X2 n=1 Tax=Mytilus californianus TaxID=6549 RepID=UPI0022458CE2|nr:uncharacterized protein LOC127731862 isoform X2 [Mytilus californianus]
MEDWNEKLIAAAQTGDLEDLRLCLQNDAEIDYQGDGGMTALMWAAEEGHLEITRSLLDSRCNTDITDEGGWMALIWAAREGHLETTRLLLDSRCNTDITDIINGYTALHYAAEWGHLQITRCLVEQGGISPLVTTLEGQTPYDLAADQQYKEVMEYLQSVMSEESSGVTAGQGMEGDMVPTEIKLMADKRSIDLYLKLLESGSEKKKDIRLVVVGKKGAGKTSLIKRLFSEENTDVTSTNGIEIHTIKCKAMSDDGIWNKLDGNNEENEIHARLLKQYKGTIEASVEEGTHKAVKETTPSTSFDESEESETVTQQPKKRKLQVTTESQVEPPVTLQQRNQALEQAKMDIEAMLKYNVDLHDREEYATLLLWDFAGDEEFYHTHQTFLSQDAIYLVVTKLNEADDKKAKEMFQLWMNSIHCYCSTTEVLGSIEEKNKSLYPPVVLVGTHKDKVEASEEVKIEDACRDCLDKYVEDVSADARRHISDKYEYFISNTEDNPSVFQLIRQNLLNLAKTMRTWNKDYPIKFIQLEKCLREKKKELPIISLNEIKQISTETPNPLNHEELMLYLNFHHELRDLVYFEDLPDYIILDTQWLSDAFKCIITAEKFQSDASRHRITDEWNDLNIRGILHSVVLDQILETNKKIFKFEEKQNVFQHKDHILKVMEKFDIIIRPTISDRDATDTKPCYYIPCMVKKGPDCPINEQFYVTEKNCTKSTWLCFKFKFLPGHLMNHLIASLSRKYEIAEVPVRGQKKRPIALFRGTVVFKLQKTSKLLVMTYPNVIQIQVWDFGKHGNIERCFFNEIDHFVTEEINTIISKRFQMTTVKFDKKCECGLAEPDCVTGFYEQDADYFCEMCTETHTNEWSDHAPIKKLDIYKKEPDQKGLVLIVNFMFSGDKKRIGSDIDVKNLTEFFSMLQYQVECRSDMTKKDLQDCFKGIESEYLTEKSEDYHSFICVIMSHGNEKGLKTKDKIITVKEIKEHFRGFIDKPRVFLIQACRGKAVQEMADGSDSPNSMQDEILERRSCVQSRNPKSEEQLYTDSEDRPKLPKDADIIVAHATTSGYASIRHPTYGSYLISAFLYVANKKYKKHDVERILQQARREVTDNPRYKPKSKELIGTRQMIIVESTSRKRFFL